MKNPGPFSLNISFPRTLLRTTRVNFSGIAHSKIRMVLYFGLTFGRPALLMMRDSKLELGGSIAFDIIPVIQIVTL